MRCVHLRNVNESLTGMLHVYMQVVAQGDPAANPGPILPDRPPSDNEKHANVDHAGDKQNKTLAGAWLEKHFSGSAAAIAALGARGNRNRNTSTMPRIHQADAKRMPRKCQGNTERMPRGMPGGCHVGHLPHIFRTYINAGGGTRLFPPIWAWAPRMRMYMRIPARAAFRTRHFGSRDIALCCGRGMLSQDASAAAGQVRATGTGTCTCAFTALYAAADVRET